MGAMTRFSGEPFPVEINAGFNPGRFPAINNEIAINLFEFENAMIPTSGFTRIMESLGGNAEGRGIFYSDSLDKNMAVIGNTLFSFTDAHFTILGQLETLNGKVFFAENGLTNLADPSKNLIGGQIALSDNRNIYIYSLDNTFVKAVNEFSNPLDFTPGTIVYQNSLFFVNALDSDRIYVSQPNNAKIIPSDNFTTISEQTVSCLAFKNTLYVFGSDKTANFYPNPENAQFFFPYTKDVNKAWEYGCYSQSSLASSEGMMAWFGNSENSTPSIMASNGGIPFEISTAGIDALIAGLPNQQDCDGFMYQEDSHSFYQINFTTDELSLLYDFSTKKWTKLTDVNNNETHPLLQTAYYKNKNKIVGILKKSGEIVEVSVRIFTHNGAIVPRTIITKNYSQEERHFILTELDVQIEQGENQETSKICLSISKDRGRTYPIQQVITLGKIGDRKNLLRFRRLGSARWWTFKLDFLSSDRFVILSALGVIRK